MSTAPCLDGKKSWRLSSSCRTFEHPSITKRKQRVGHRDTANWHENWQTETTGSRSDDFHPLHTHERLLPTSVRAVKDGDARRLPFADGAFDVIVTHEVLHNIYNAAERDTAVREIARVLTPGGRLFLGDVRHTGRYMQVLRECGLEDAAP